VFPLYEVMPDGTCACGGSLCKSPRNAGKHPRTTHGVKDATTSPEIIRQWWAAWPKANIGVATGSVSGIIVLDVDPDKGGDDSLRTLPEPPVTPRSLTGGGGQHILFRYDPATPLRNTSGALGPGLDTRSDGGYIVAPPSNHISGRVYAWDCDLHPDDTPLAPVPQWLIDRLAQPVGPTTAAATPPPPEAVDGIAARVLEWTLRRVTRQGLGRNEGGLQLAVQLRDNGLTPEQAEPIVMQYQAAVTGIGDHPYEAVEAQASLRQAYRRPARSPWPPSYGVRIGSGPQGIIDGAAVPVRPMTDLGNAERFVSDHGDIVRYVHGWATWHIWDGCRWREDTDGEAIRLAKHTVRRILAEEVPSLYDSKAQEALAKHAVKSESAGRIAAMLELARVERPVPLTPDAMDADIHLLNVSNGTLDLRTGELYPHDPLLYCSRVAPVAYRPEAQAPLWLAFLARIFDGRQEVIDYLQRAIGYSLTGDTSEQCVFILWGSGANGKSTFLETIKALLADYAQSADPKSFQEQHGGSGARSDIARLKGARFVVATESESGARLSESLIKSVTGGEKLVARRLYQDFFEFEPAFKLWLATNHKPHIRNTDHGIRRRIRLIPFAVTIPPEERDKGLRNRLMEELPGIFAWAVRGCLSWREGGLREPETVLAATQEYHEEMDRLAPFIEERCELGSQYSTLAADLFASYLSWCEESGEKPLSRVNFSLAMQDRGLSKIRMGRTASRGVAGIKLLQRDPAWQTRQTKADTSAANVGLQKNNYREVLETPIPSSAFVCAPPLAAAPVSTSCTHPTFVLRAGERICPSCGIGVA
jgi:putative DNA primase/helicase